MRSLTALLLALIILTSVTPAKADIRQTYAMSYTFENRGSLSFTFNRDDLSIPLFIETEYQKVVIKSATPSIGQQYIDSDGNIFVEPGISLEIKPGQKVSFTVVYEIDSKDEPKPNIDQTKAGQLSDIPQNLVLNYTSPTGTYQPGKAEILSLAKSLTNDKLTVLAKVLRLISWFQANLTYDNYEIPRRADETLKERKGDCDDQSILLISMLRGLGIPSYMEVGIVFNDGIDSKETSWAGHLENDQKGVGWHGWAVVYIPPWGWMPVDVVYLRPTEPLDVIRNAPEYGSEIISSFRIINQDYVEISRSTREKVINSGLYATMKDEVLVSNQPSWLTPALIVLAIAVGGGIVFMFITARSPLKSRKLFNHT